MEHLCTDVKAWIESKGRYFRKRKHDPFGESVARTWGYVPAPAVAEWRAVIVPALGRGAELPQISPSVIVIVER